MTVPKSTCCGNKGNFTAPVIRFHSAEKAPAKSPEIVEKIVRDNKSPDKVLNKPPRAVKVQTKEVLQQHNYHHKRRFSVKSDHGSNEKLDHESRRLARSHQITKSHNVSNNSVNYAHDNVCPIMARQIFVRSLLKEYFEVNKKRQQYRARSEPKQCGRQLISSYYYSNNQCGTTCPTTFYAT